MQNSSKRSAHTPKYVSPNQLTIAGFETPFEQSLDPENRWVVLKDLIPWDEIINVYLKVVPVSETGRPPLSPRIVLASLMIKHMCNLDDRETVDQISENIYMQYFLGYSSFDPIPPFDASLFVEFRKRLGIESVNAINEKIVELKTRMGSLKKTDTKEDNNQIDENPKPNESQISENKGRLIVDATACPQDIAYPTDLDLLSGARVKLEHLVDKYYDVALHENKPRMFRRIARKIYLKTAQKRKKSGKALRKAIRKQLSFVKRDLMLFNALLDAYPRQPLNKIDLKYLLVIQTLYDQQQEMYDERKHTIEHRIVSIHQPHVRPIVRGKSQAKVEFGSKIHVSLIDGISFLDELSWDAFNEGTHLMDYVEKYKKRFGFYPREILADQIYCNRANRVALKEKGIKLIGKPLGRPSAVKNVSPGERNPIEGKFGQAKTGYGLNRIKARLSSTSESWIACIILVLNLVKLAGAALPRLYLKLHNSFSAKNLREIPGLRKIAYYIKNIFQARLSNSQTIYLKCAA